MNESSLVYRLEVIVLDPNNLKVDSITNCIKHSLASINCDSITEHQRTGKVINKYHSTLELINEKSLEDMLCDWEMFSESRALLNEPVLFIYNSNIYSGWYYKDADDEVNNSVSYAINIPDKENKLVSTNFKSHPTNWMYARYIKMPLMLKSNCH